MGSRFLCSMGGKYQLTKCRQRIEQAGDFQVGAVLFRIIEIRNEIWLDGY
jgi:hypothetical protein